MKLRRCVQVVAFYRDLDPTVHQLSATVEQA